VTTTTSSKPIPTHIQDVIDKALGMDWDVERTPASVKITPPKNSKLKPFSLSRTTPMAPPQLKNHLDTLGFASVWQAWQRSQNGEAKAEPKADAKAKASSKPEKPVRVCPECTAEGLKEPFSTTHPPALGVHRRSKHGILGASSEAVRKREATAAKKAPSKKTAPAKKAAPAKAATVPAPRTDAPTAKQEPLINISGLPVSVAAPLGELLSAISATSGDAADLQQEVQTLRDFRDQVEAEVTDGNKAPVEVVYSILSLVKETKRK
jgi:hypothetical protein